MPTATFPPPSFGLRDVNPVTSATEPGPSPWRIRVPLRSVSEPVHSSSLDLFAGQAVHSDAQFAPPHPPALNVPPSLPSLQFSSLELTYTPALLPPRQSSRSPVPPLPPASFVSGDAPSRHSSLIAPQPRPLNQHLPPLSPPLPDIDPLVLVEMIAPPGSSSFAPSDVYIAPSLDTLRNIPPDSAPAAIRLDWAQDVLRALDRHVHPLGLASDLTNPSEPNREPVPAVLDELLDTAVPLVLSYTEHEDKRVACLALYLRSKLLSSGSCPQWLALDPRQAFRDAEAAARGGEARAWFRLGRDYESTSDEGRARDCFERGRANGDPECTYRLGMAHLLGQLGLPSDPATAVSILRRASELGTIDFPIPPYVYGMILAGELVSPTSIPPNIVLPPNPPLPALADQQNHARASLERAARLGHAPAQYKCGSLYEHASLGCAYDPLMSVQWYSFASRGGDVEADMALSKWFLCGADGHFDKNEEVARTFAEKAAKKGHPNGCFAMGYYSELGIGGRKDLAGAKRWYAHAAELGNNDAHARLTALSSAEPASMSMAEHESRLNDTLVRRRTAAKASQPHLHHSHSQPAISPRVPSASGRPLPISPTPVPQPYPMSNSFARPPVPQYIQAAAQACVPLSPSPRRMPATGGPGTDPRGIDVDVRRGSAPTPTHDQLAPPAGGQRRYSLADGGPQPSRPSSRASMAERRTSNAGPKTFAEMGFVSKPVEEESCVLM
ncbi:hypothetical protein Q5752_002762 [Cryptotrichosporon argae]